MVSAVKRIIVPFHGDTSGVDDLTWGQREIFTAMRTQDSWLPVPFVRVLAPGTSIEDVVAELEYCLARYDSMRTRLEFDPDGEARQAVCDHGEIELEVYEAGDEDPAVTVAGVQERYLAADYDFERDWPVRAAVIVRDGAPSHLLTVYCHLVLDGLARAILVSDLIDRGPAPADVLRPIELAQWERGEVARRASATSLAYWERLLREIPARRFPPSAADPRTPRYWEAVFESRAMHLALRVISPGAAGSTALLLTLFAVALARVTASNPVVAQVVVSNRFRSHLADVFAPVNQAGLWVVDVADTTFAEAFARARRRATSAYKSAYYDPRDRRDLIARISAERGEDIDVACFVNDRRMASAMSTSDDGATIDDVRAALAQTSFEWRTRTNKPSERLFINAEDVPGLVCLTAWTDTHHLAAADLEAVLREMELVAVEAATDAVS